MKNVLNSARRCNGNSFACAQLLFFKNAVLILGVFTLMAFGLAGCQKEVSALDSENHNSGQNLLSASVPSFNYTGLSAQTTWELQQARAATAKYQNINNALADGYFDIGVVVPNMGHHYMNLDYRDGEFDIRKPEILVYNPNEKGKMELVAVEYAVPLELSANAPEGFSGSADVWDRNTGFGLWLLHAWVWAYNPSGVFNPTNPSVHLH